MISTKVKTEKGLVKNLRDIRDKMDLDTQDMSFEEVKAYLKAMIEKNTDTEDIRNSSK